MPGLESAREYGLYLLNVLLDKINEVTEQQLQYIPGTSVP